MSDSGCSCQSCTSGAGACGCCEGVESITPRAIANRPGLARLSGRIGTHADFLETMQARLATHALQEGGRPLAALRTRDPADASIALLDAFAVTGDVLTFYQERIANEGYLPTATQDRSVRELARLIGYEPGPGVSASTYLAFTLDSDAETPVTIPAGTGAKSLPRQNELPQIFETSRDLVARARWNLLGVRTSEPERGQNRDADNYTTDIYLAGTDTGLKPGDALLFQYGQGTPEPMRVVAVDADTTAKHTFVAVEPWQRIAAATDQDAVEVLVTDDMLKALIELRDQAPGGANALIVVNGINHLESVAAGDRNAARLELVDEIAVARKNLGTLPHTKVREWLDKVEACLQPANLAAASYDGPPPTVPFAGAAQAADAQASDDDDVPTRPSWIEKLALPASVPPRSAEKLALSTSTSFAKGSDAAYKTLSVAVPAVGEQLGAALSGTRVLEGDLKVFAFRVRSGLFGRTFPKRTGVSRSESTTETYEIGEWPIASLINDGQELFLRENAEILTLESPQEGILPNSWVMVDMRAIDAPKDDGGGSGPITSGPGANGGYEERWLLAPTQPLLLARAVSVDPKVARADYGGIGDSTGIRLSEADRWFKVRPEYYYYVGNQDVIDRDFQLIRRTTVYARPEQLALAARPLVQNFCVEPEPGKPLPWIELDGTYSGLEPGRYVAVSGERADIDGVAGVVASEIAMIAEVVHGVRGPDSEPITPGDKDAALGDAVHTFLRFANPLSYCYGRGGVTLQANVAKATHGETVRETLGNGDAAAPRQRFPLKRFPLTYTPAPNATGLATSLEVFVDDIRWRPESNFIATGRHERVYTVRNDAGGKATVIFPDGRDGARPPTGSQNIRAVYRSGIGRPGNLGAGRIDQLVVRPLGVKGVVNPVAATGGADAEPRERTRKNAPVSTMALDRLVSIRDHEDFARSFAGIALASAQVMASGSRRIVHLTVAAEDDAPLDPNGALLENLRGAFRRLGDPDLPVAVTPRELKLLITSAKVRIDPDRLWEPVAQAIRARLLDLFGFEARELAQGAAPSVLVAAIQSVPGVAWVDLDVFGGVSTMGGPAGARLPRTPDQIAQGVEKAVAQGVSRWVPALPARPDRLASQALLPAELLLLSADVPASLVLNQIK
ncbi:putative baseplate assembly protein [Sphingomonas sp. DG1-23]|uniref:putative baseplate assembly protein n=1 Tax=Sphingomonas sp. DG1-23 TaxID=3068316 RepID=UPI0027402ED0|nr:putative baseplate assembly protein [Sphingomonas sp. DG1-23]MDP5279841.1 putative baseplate assembly protein [Sphingomonas sp. DG1-23]